jgi:dolichol kinase
MMLENPLMRVSSFFVLILAFQIVVTKLSLGKDTRRRLQHAMTGHALVQISYVLPIDIAIVALAVGCGTIYYVRFYQRDLYQQLFEPLLRPEELVDGVLPGAFYFLLGTLITASLFPLDMARYAVECLSLADPLASWVGKSISSPRITRNASVAGCCTCWVTAFLLGILWFDFPWPMAFLGSLACTIAEAFPILNDNLSIPIVTAGTVFGYQTLAR